MKIHTVISLGLCLSLSAVGGCFAVDEPEQEDEADSEGMPDDDSTEPDDDDDDDDDGEPMVPADEARLRVVHGSADAGPVDIYVAGTDTPAIAGLVYGQSTEYLALPEGEYVFEVRSAGATPQGEPVFTTEALTLPGGATITALAAGSVGAEQADAAFRVLPLVDDFMDSEPGHARIRVVHAGADAPTVDLDLGDDGSVELAGLERFADTGMAGVSVPADESFQVGIIAGEQRVTAFTAPALPEGAELLVVATGRLDRLPREADGFSLLAVFPEAPFGFIRQNPVVYSLHAGPDAPEVDICAGDVALANHVTFGELTGVQVRPGAYTLDVYTSPSGCAGTPVITDETPELEGGESYLVIATGEIEDASDEPPLQLAAYREQFSLDAPDDAVLTLVHAASAPEVDVGVVTDDVIEDGNVLAADLKWPERSDEIEVTPLTYPVGVAPAGTDHPLASFHIAAEAGARSFIIAAGDLTPEGSEVPFRLLGVDTSTSPWSVASILAN